MRFLNAILLVTGLLLCLGCSEAPRHETEIDHPMEVLSVLIAEAEKAGQNTSCQEVCDEIAKKAEAKLEGVKVTTWIASSPMTRLPSFQIVLPNGNTYLFVTSSGEFSCVPY